MKNNPPSSPARLPAAERAKQMGETLDRLEAGVPKMLTRVPGLGRLLAHFFALFRTALERLGQDELVAEVGDAVVVAVAPVAVDDGVAVVGRRVRAVRGRSAVGRACADVQTGAELVAVRVAVTWDGVAPAIDDALGGGGDFFKNFENGVLGWRRLALISLRYRNDTGSSLQRIKVFCFFFSKKKRLPQTGLSPATVTRCPARVCGQ